MAFDISTGFRFSKISVECTLHSEAPPCLSPIFFIFLFILGPILPGVSLPTWPKSWTTFTGQTAQVTSFILLFITPEYLKWWATAYPLFLLSFLSAYCLPFGNSIFFNLYYLILRCQPITLNLTENLVKNNSLFRNSPIFN